MENEESHSPLTTQEGIKYSEKRKIHRKEEDSKNYLKTFLVTKVTIGSKTVLPSWIPENGTVMQSAMLKDAVIWHGKFSPLLCWVSHISTYIKVSLSHPYYN